MGRMNQIKPEKDTFIKKTYDLMTTVFNLSDKRHKFKIKPEKDRFL
jgi:hypothetical protein